jgi:hypothetical protein
VPCWRFRALRAPWDKAVGEVATYIDQVLADIAGSKVELQAAARRMEARLMVESDQRCAEPQSVRIEPPELSPDVPAPGDIDPC